MDEDAGLDTDDAATGADEQAVDPTLATDPDSVTGLLAKAASREHAGDLDAACLLYTRGLHMAAQQRPAADDPSTEQAAVAQATDALARLRARIDAAREARLRSRGIAAADRSPRFRHALDIAAGRRRPYAQEPTAFTYPGLPAIPFFDTAAFGWVAALEAAAPAIRGELLALLAEKQDRFRAYIQDDQSAGPLGGNSALLNNTDWSVLTLCENGWLSPDIIDRCPQTWAAVLATPMPRIAGWGPTVVFSLLKAGARIAAHTGMVNTRLICHLPLVVPPDCGFRVGDEVRRWEEGRLMIFDDTIEHEAWNDSDRDRVVLIFDIWRPELDARERHELTALFSD